MQVFAILMVLSIPVTRWVDPLGRNPLTYKEFMKYSPKTQLQIGEVYRVGNGTDRIYVIVNSELYRNLTSEIAQFASDISADGYTVVVDTAIGGTASELRNFLASQLQFNIVGAIFIGRLPIAWFHMDEPYWGMVEEFPIDYYFMDLNGNWLDTDGDGLFDLHQGSTEPEIWVGRLWGSNLSYGSEAELVRSFLERDHAYRTQGTSVPLRALSFIDDDWQYYITTAGLDEVYDTVHIINDPMLTTADNYKQRLADGYEFVFVASHSSPWGHTFKPINYGGTVFNFEMEPLWPDALFLNLFSCSAARYVERDDIGNMYIFEGNGLAVIGSAKTGAMMLAFDEFMGYMADGASIGDAFKSWMSEYAELYPDWHYGLTILGDPTLHVRADRIEVVRNDTVNCSDWNATSLVTSDFTDAQQVGLTDEHEIVLVWSSGRDIRSEIYLKRYTESSGWSDEIPVASDVYWDFYPSLTKGLGDTVWIAWQSFRNENHDIYVAKVFGTHVVSYEPAAASPSNYELQPSIYTLPSGEPAVAYLRWHNGHGELWIAYKVGSNWLQVPVVQNDADNVSPQVVKISPSRYFLIYTELRPDRSDVVVLEGDGVNFTELSRFSGVSDGKAAMDDSGTIWLVFKRGNTLQATFIWGNVWSRIFDVADSVISVSIVGLENGAAVTWSSLDHDVFVGRLVEGHVDDVQPVAAGNANEINPFVMRIGDSLAITFLSDQFGHWDIFMATGALAVSEDTHIRPEDEDIAIVVRGQDVSFFSRFDRDFEIRIYDLSGRCILTAQADGRFTFRAPHSGVYFYRAKTAGRRPSSGKFVVLRSVK
ncbi:MAG: hypothetical protein DRQ10_03295 [Candidatus Hydrothermota bacterium]|nr:MAG: hypothetical protein DRQ10_03295 [Candidatus Hydrothermae bacterium]